MASCRHDDHGAEGLPAAAPQAVVATRGAALESQGHRHGLAARHRRQLQDRGARRAAGRAEAFEPRPAWPGPPPHIPQHEAQTACLALQAHNDGCGGGAEHRGLAAQSRERLQLGSGRGRGGRTGWVHGEHARVHEEGVVHLREVSCTLAGHWPEARRQRLAEPKRERGHVEVNHRQTLRCSRALDGHRVDARAAYRGVEEELLDGEAALASALRQAGVLCEGEHEPHVAAALQGQALQDGGHHGGDAQCACPTHKPEAEGLEGHNNALCRVRGRCHRAVHARI
mmetsp:Transcript_140069/g.390433  ORF Transcript_140069/g.390433 Transcript_140069/m.390433 type:complete len:284 (-) Transcript_140069:825-1676(-)